MTFLTCHPANAPTQLKQCYKIPTWVPLKTSLSRKSNEVFHPEIIDLLAGDPLPPLPFSTSCSVKPFMVALSRRFFSSFVILSVPTWAISPTSDWLAEPWYKIVLLHKQVHGPPG